MWALSIHCPEISPGHRVVGDVHCVVATKYIPSFGSVVFNQSSTMYPVGTTHPTDVIQIKNRRSWSKTEDKQYNLQLPLSNCIKLCSCSPCLDFHSRDEMCQVARLPHVPFINQRDP